MLSAQPSVAVIVASCGRPKIVESLLGRLAAQTRKPDHVFVVGATPQDFPERPGENLGATFHLGRTGSGLQRNDGLDLAGDRFGAIVFFDDDFVPSRFWIERFAAMLDRRPDVGAVTGEVLADGIRGPGIELAAAVKMVEGRDAARNEGDGAEDGVLPYGCNMGFRFAAIAGLRFDENLPGYAWQEDQDFGARLAPKWRRVRARALWGVHLGAKSGKTSGVKLGYAQVANVIYLVRKGTLRPGFGLKMAAGNVAMNLWKSLRPEAFIDRRGRLRGNLIAIRDALFGKMSPPRAMLLQ